MKLIDKTDVAAEIERRKYQFVSQAEAFREIGKEEKESYFAALAFNMNSLLCYLDTLEVKEVDLDYIKKELDRVVKIYRPDEVFGWGTLYNIATHFFELGLSVSNKTQKGEEI